MSKLGFITKISFGIFFLLTLLNRITAAGVIGQNPFFYFARVFRNNFPAYWASDGVVSAYILFSLDQNRINNINVTFFKKVLDTIYLKTRKAKCVRTRKEFRFPNLFRRIHINKLRM